MALIRMVKGPSPGRTFRLKPGVTVVGREPSQCDIVMKHFAISRRHLQLEVVGDKVYLEDLNSHNGTRVNGDWLEPGASGRRELEDHDRFELCGVHFHVHLTDDSDFYRVEDDRTEVLSTADMSAESTHDLPGALVAARLKTILAVIERLSDTLQWQEVVPAVLASLLESFPQADKVALFMGEKIEDLVPTSIERRSESDEGLVWSRALVRRAAEQNKAILSRDSLVDLPDSESAYAASLRSAMYAPLLTSDQRLLGLLLLDSPERGPHFQKKDLSVLSGIAQHIGMVIENSRLRERAARQHRDELEQRFRNLVENSIQGIAVHRNGRPCFVNAAWAELHGLTVEEALELEDLHSLVVDEDRERVRAYLQSRVEGVTNQRRFEYRAIAKEQRRIWVESLVTHVEWDGEPAIQEAVYDITSRKLSEFELRRAYHELESRVEARTAALAAANERLQKAMDDSERYQSDLHTSENLYHSLVDRLPVCVARKDLQGRYTFANPALLEILGQTHETVIGKTDFELFPPELAERYRRDDLEVMSTEHLVKVVEPIEMESGVRRAQMLKTPLLEADGTVCGVQMIFWDITEQYAAEQVRQQYAQELERSNRDLELFASMASHDLQAPLRSIVGFGDLLAREYRDQFGSSGAEYIDFIVTDARRMQHMLNDLLAYSKVTTEAEVFRKTDSNAALDRALANLRILIEENEAEVEREPLPQVLADATQLTLVFQNLIANAINYRREDRPRVKISAEADGEHWHFQIEDNGVGISSDARERIFVIFQRLTTDPDRPGTGMGLAICRRIVQRHGGKIWVESNAETGSVFHFTLPTFQPGVMDGTSREQQTSRRQA